MEAARHPWPALGVLLMRDGLVSREQLEEVVAEQGDGRGHRVSSQRLGEALVERGLVTSADIARLVAEQHELPFVELAEHELPVQLASQLPEALSRRCSAVPISLFPDGSLVVAVADPTEIGYFDDLRSALAVPIRFAVATPEAIADAIDFAYSTLEDAAPVPVPAESHDEPVVVVEPRTVPADDRRWPLFGSLLLESGLVSADELYAALAQQRLSQTKRLGELLVVRGALTDRQVGEVLAEQHELPFVDLDETVLDPAAASLLPIDLARKHQAVPVAYLPNGAVLLAVADPTSALAVDELRVAVGGAVQFGVAVGAQIDRAIAALPIGGEPEAVLGEPDEAPAEPEPDAEPEPEPEPEPTPVAGPAAGTPTVVEDALRSALERGASVVHFVPGPDGVAVRARFNGSLTDLVIVSSENLADLSNRRRISVARNGTAFELNVVSLPTRWGEHVTLRVLGDEVESRSLAALFPTANVEEAIRDALGRDSGLLVVCGPAESGRTTTLYAAVDEVDARDRVVLTIEDPIEHLVAGVEQCEVDLRSGVTFASGLHAILRSDADVAVVGELLDAEAARLAVRGARGCLVLTTLDAATASAGAQRLLEFEVDPRAASVALAGVIAQRLLRRTCLGCRDSYYATAVELVELGCPHEESGRRLLGRGRGCESCGETGYSGHVGVIELLPLTDEIRELVAGRASAAEIEQAAVAAGMQTLRESAVQLCLEGVTTIAELRRVFPEHGS